MNILEQKNNKLLNREEIIIEITSKVIPSKVEAIKQIAEKLKKPEDNVVIGKIDTQFGNHTFKVSAKVYNDVESKDKYETISRKVRKKQIEEAKKVAEEKAKADEEAKKASETPEPEPAKSETNDTPAKNSDTEVAKTEETPKEETNNVDDTVTKTENLDSEVTKTESSDASDSKTEEKTE